MKILNKMAKVKSVLDVSSDEIKQETATPEAEKLKIVYVHTSHHAQAKSTAALRGMKLRDYIEYLIEQDKKKG